MTGRISRPSSNSELRDLPGPGELVLQLRRVHEVYAHAANQGQVAEQGPEKDRTSRPNEALELHGSACPPSDFTIKATLSTTSQQKVGQVCA